MSQENIILLVILALGIIGRSEAVAQAACALLLIRLFGWDKLLFSNIERFGIKIGLVFITAAVFIPLASGRIQLTNIANVLATPKGLIAVAMAALITYLSGQGVGFLQVEPHLVTGTIVGSIIGAAFLKGVPVGPLTAMGATLLIVRLLGIK